MNKIQWREVTWYSKLVVLLALVTFPFLGFYYGMQYGESVAYIRSSAALAPTSLDYYHNVGAWQTTSDTQNGYSIAYPLDFQVDQNYTNGNPVLTIMIPSIFEPQTNFADAKLTVSHNSGNAAVAGCLTPDASGGPTQATSTATIGGVDFTVFYTSDAAAGSRFDTTSYRAVSGGQCYEVNYTIHSTQLGNYPPQYQLNPFVEAKVIDVMNRVVGTFRFL